jgi:hypothetical protein
MRSDTEPPGKRSREEERLVLCRCPLCGKTHFKAMWWTGNGKVPLKYCVRCFAVVSGTNGHKSHGVSLGGKRKAAE